MDIIIEIKSVIPVQKVDNEVKWALQPRSHDVVNIEKCFIQYDEHNKLMNILEI